MSMGVWNENAQTDETSQMREAVRKAREQAKLDKLAEKHPELVKLAAKVTKDTTRTHGGRRTKGARRTTQTLYPYRDKWADRNFRVVSCKVGETVIEYSPVQRYKGEKVRPCRRVDQTGEASFTPEWYIQHLWEDADRTLVSEPTGRIIWDRLIPFLHIPKRDKRPYSELWAEKYEGDIYRLRSRTVGGFIPLGMDTSDLTNQAYQLLKEDEQDETETEVQLVFSGLMNQDQDIPDEQE